MSNPTSARHLLLVLSNAQPGEDDAFNEWYDQVHVPEVLALPGYRAATRYRVEPNPTDEHPAHRYVTLYEVDVEPTEAVATTLAAAEAGRIHMSPSARTDDAAILTLTMVAPRVEAGD